MAAAPTCPFCGGTATLELSEHGIDRYNCQTCGKYWALRSGQRPGAIRSAAADVSSRIFDLLNPKRTRPE